MQEQLDRKIREEFKDDIYDSHEIFFRSDAVLKFIDWCDENDISIIGIEGFEVKEHSITPRLDMIADFSESLGRNDDWNLLREKLNQSARNFFVDSDIHGLVFNFVVRQK
jgi:hypothetical protein